MAYICHMNSHTEFYLPIMFLILEIIDSHIKKIKRVVLNTITSIKRDHINNFGILVLDDVMY